MKETEFQYFQKLSLVINRNVCLERDGAILSAVLNQRFVDISVEIFHFSILDFCGFKKCLKVENISQAVRDRVI